MNTLIKGKRNGLNEIYGSRRVLNGLDLFSGIGGMSLALAPWVRPVAYCEIDKYCQGVLLSRMREGQLHVCPVWDDITTFTGLRVGFLPPVDIIYGGFPCQDISVAGHGAGLGGQRSGLFWELHRLVREIMPQFVFVENVPAIRTRGLKDVVRAFTELRYHCRWTIVSAAEVGAKHLRKRWFMLASNADCKTLREQQGRRGWSDWKEAQFDSSNGDEWGIGWPSQGTFKPRVARAGDGISFAVDRDSSLGNAVVPHQAREAFKRLMGLPS